MIESALLSNWSCVLSVNLWTQFIGARSYILNVFGLSWYEVNTFLWSPLIMSLCVIACGNPRSTIWKQLANLRSCMYCRPIDSPAFTSHQSINTLTHSNSLYVLIYACDTCACVTVTSPTWHYLNVWTAVSIECEHDLLFSREDCLSMLSRS